MSIFSFLSQTSFTFEDKKPYENVLLLLHRHWIVLALKLAAFGIFGLIPIIAGIVLRSDLVGSTGAIYWFAVSIFYLFWWYGVFYAITMYLLDFWIVTDHRIIDSEQHGFFRRSVAELHLSKIQDISVVISGVIPTFFDFGNLEVQTAAAQEKFFFKQIPHPNHVKNVITEAQVQFIKIHPDDIEIHEATTIPTP